MFLADNDPELEPWLINLGKMGAGSFLQSIRDAAVRADVENYALLRPVLLQLKAK